MAEPLTQQILDRLPPHKLVQPGEFLDGTGQRFIPGVTLAEVVAGLQELRKHKLVTESGGRFKRTELPVAPGRAQSAKGNGASGSVSVEQVRKEMAGASDTLFVIEKDVPLPPRNTVSSAYPFEQMSVGDSFAIRSPRYKSCSQAARKLKPQYTFSFRKISSTHYRCWRIA